MLILLVCRQHFEYHGCSRMAGRCCGSVQMEWFYVYTGLCLPCCVGFSPVLSSYPPVAEFGLLTVWAPFLQSVGSRQRASVAAALGLWSTVSVAVLQWLSGSKARGIFSDQRSNTCLLNWQGFSSPLSHQGSPRTSVFNEHILRSVFSLLKNGP